MTVSELIEELKKLPDQNQEVVAFDGEMEAEFNVSEVRQSMIGPVIDLDFKC